MASPAEQVALLISAGAILMTSKYCLVAAVTLWSYEYFLTLPDEIEYTWFGGSSWMFGIFVMNRYWPLWYIIWLSVALWSPGFTKHMCDKSSWLHVFYFAFATLFAQVVITLRVYAVTSNNRWIRAYLSSLTLVQFAFVMYLTIRFALEPSAEIPALPLDEFHLCTFIRWRTGEIVNTVFSLVYDFSAFLFIAFSVKRRARTRVRALGATSLLDKIFQDATTYFLMIFSSHLVLLFFLFLAPESSQLLPAGLNALLIPIMITRLMLSLKKVANSPEGTLADSTQPGSVRFAHHTIGGSERVDSVALKNLSPKRRTGPPQEA